jgi:hypothetical protein
MAEFILMAGGSLRFATPGANLNYIGARNLPAMRDIKFLMAFQKALTEFLPPPGDAHEFAWLNPIFSPAATLCLHSRVKPPIGAQSLA